MIKTTTPASRSSPSTLRTFAPGSDYIDELNSILKHVLHWQIETGYVGDTLEDSADVEVAKRSIKRRQSAPLPLTFRTAE